MALTIAPVTASSRRRPGATVRLIPARLDSRLLLPSTSRPGWGLTATHLTTEAANQEASGVGVDSNNPSAQVFSASLTVLPHINDRLVQSTRTEKKEGSRGIVRQAVVFGCRRFLIHLLCLVSFPPFRCGSMPLSLSFSLSTTHPHLITDTV